MFSLFITLQKIKANEKAAAKHNTLLPPNAY